jgi:hypothetical protein
MKLKLLLASIMTLTLAASSRAQWEWIETVYDPILVPFYNVKLGPEWTASETREYEWFAAFHCNFTVVGDEPNPDPNWRLLFADICDNWWWDSTIFTATIPANYIVQNKVEYYVRTGNNVFVHFDTEETVGRTLDERVSTRIYWEAGPPPSGGAGQGS